MTLYYNFILLKGCDLNAIHEAVKHTLMRWRIVIGQSFVNIPFKGTDCTLA